MLYIILVYCSTLEEQKVEATEYVPGKPEQWPPSSGYHYIYFLHEKVVSCSINSNATTKDDIL